MIKRVVLSIVLLAGINALASAKIILPGIFTDHMVLQQKSEVAIWGWGNPAEKVKIIGSWNTKDTVVAVADRNSRWSAKIRTKEAGGPYTLSINGNSKIQINDVMLGEVWICSGQSNMEWSVNHKIKNGEEEAAKANYPNIRFFHVPKIGAETPQEDCYANWTVCTPETMRSTSAVGYFFGRELNTNLNVPIGLIVSAWGGTPAEVWVKKEYVENDPILRSNVYDEKAAWWPSAPGTTYNSMIYPIVPYGISGAIWYQGESNRFKPFQYALLMKALIDNWRNDFGKEFPFYFVQIAPYKYKEEEMAYIVREQQMIASRSISNTGMVVVSDLVDDIANIHPKNKQEVGKRLANYALAEVYKKYSGEYKSPVYNSMKIEKNKIRLEFVNAVDGLKCPAKTPAHFLIAGDNRKFVPATAKIEGNTIVVSSKEVKEPVAVRFCFDNTTMPDIFNKAGLPLAAFRTDSW